MRLPICAAAALFAAPALAQDQVTYQLDWLPGGDKAPIYVCIQEGFCEDAGLEVDIESGRGSSEAITKLSTGISDIGSAGLGAVMAAVATEDVPVTVVMSIFSQGPHAFYAIAGTGIASIGDIEGQRVATSPFTSSNVYLPRVLADNGMSMDDITLTNADPGALGPLLMTGQTDAIIAWLTDVTRYTNQAQEAGHEIVVLPWSDAGLELYSAALVASDQFLEERPDVARRFVGAFHESVQFSLENPEAAAAAVAETVPEVSAEDVIGSWNDASALVMNEVTEADGLGAIEEGRLQSTWELVAEAQELDPGALDPESIVDRSFLPDGGS